MQKQEIERPRNPLCESTAEDTLLGAVDMVAAIGSAMGPPGEMWDQAPAGVERACDVLIGALTHALNLLRAENDPDLYAEGFVVKLDDAERRQLIAWAEARGVAAEDAATLMVMARLESLRQACAR